MGFLDNLENSLKSLETSEERGTSSERARRDTDRNQALALAPWAEKLKDSPYIKKLYDEAALAGHRIRTKIYMAWFDSMFRLEARERRLELRPTSTGILAAFVEPDGETKTQPVDLNGDPAQLMKQWLG